MPNWEQVHSANSGTKKQGLLGLREIEAKKIVVETSMGKNKKKIKGLKGDSNFQGFSWNSIFFA